MRFPWFAIASAICTAVGGFGLYWYSSLPPKQQAEADALTADYAQKVYGRAVGELTESQARHVSALVKDHFTG